MKNMIQFTGKNGEFQIAHLVQQNEWNFPVANEEGIKSSVTQNFGGDCKLDQNHFLLEPVSIENLHNNRSTRNIWCTVDGKDHYSLTGASAQNEYERFLGKEDDMVLDAGFMWQEVKRIIKDVELEATVRIFAPLGYGAEVMQVKIVNKGKDTRKISVTPAIPLYGRSADNLRDHRHVTSLLHRIKTSENGVICKPVLSFDERGHQKNNMIYYVAGSTENGENPVKCGGKVMVIDGGFSKAYQKETGIAGYTLIYNSYGLILAAHEPFESTEAAIEKERDIHSDSVIINRVVSRKTVGDTDVGNSIRERIADLEELLKAYRSGKIIEKI